MVCFVEDDQVVRFGDLQQFPLPVGAADEVARHNDGRLLMPDVSANGALRMALHRRRRIPAELLSIVDRPVEIEFFSQLDLPLRAHYK